MNLGRVMELVGILLFSAVLSLGVNQYGVALSVVKGTSMRPTLYNGDRLLINKFTFLLSTPHRGEVITFRDPSNEKRFLVKRVVGIPGDKIEIIDGVLYLNGRRTQERYTDTQIEDGDFGPAIVRPGTVFVMGDNRHRFASRDSRYENVGLVPVALIDGKVEAILWRPSLAAYL